MGMSAGGTRAPSGKGGRRSVSGRYKPLAEINVTPFVDVMLVLLIVFMVTAPLLTAGVRIDLPKSQAKALAQDDKPLEIAIDQTGAIFLADTEITLEELQPRLAAIAKGRKDVRIYVRGDKSLDYGRVMAVVGSISAAGYSKVALISENR